MELKKIKEIFSFEKGSLQSSKCTAGEYNFITASSVWKTHNSFDYECEALIVAVAASGSLGRVHYVNDKFISSDLCFVLKPKDSNKFPVNLEFYYSIFKSLKEDLVKSTATGTAKKSINKTNFGNYVIPYYNIEEQNRLKPVFEKVADNSEKINQELSNQKQLVSKLKQAILQEAIKGILTQEWREQNPNTEPASELLKHIKAEKVKLIKDKKIKKEKPLPTITEKEIPFEIPESWVWCRLGDVLLYSDSGKSPNCKKIPVRGNEWGVLTTTAIQENKFKENENKVLPKFFKVNPIQQVFKDNILITRAGPLNRTGVSCKVDSISSNLILSDKTIRLVHPPKLINPDFISQSLNSQSIRKLLIPKMTGMAESQVNISQKNIKLTEFPVPPLEEQKAIVVKVETLMQKCSALEQEITQSEQHANMLMQAVLKEAFESKTEKTEEYANA